MCNLIAFFKSRIKSNFDYVHDMYMHFMYSLTAEISVGLCENLIEFYVRGMI